MANHRILPSTVWVPEWCGFSFEYFRHRAKVMRDNEQVHPDWPALTLLHEYEAGFKHCWGLAQSFAAMGEFAQRQQK